MYLARSRSPLCARHHQHRYLRYYRDLCITCNWTVYEVMSLAAPRVRPLAQGDFPPLRSTEKLTQLSIMNINGSECYKIMDDDRSQVICVIRSDGERFGRFHYFCYLSMGIPEFADSDTLNVCALSATRSPGVKHRIHTCTRRRATDRFLYGEMLQRRTHERRTNYVFPHVRLQIQQTSVARDTDGRRFMSP